MGNKKVTKIEPIPKISAFAEGVTKKRRVAAYARVSTTAEEQETSLVAQREYFEEFIKEHKDWVFVDVYYDDGISGLSFRKREGFNRMISDALAGKIDLILTKSLSRFARNTVDTLTTIRKLKAANIEVYFEKENIYTFDSKGEFLITIMSSIAQEESRSISENVTWGTRKRFADGKYHVPYEVFLGYKKGADGTLQVVEEEAKIVRLIYLLYLVGKSSFTISNTLDELGIPTPRNDGKWNKTTALSILSNEKYKGDALLQKTITVDFLTKKRKPNEGEITQYYITEAHDAIVSPEVFEIVQETLEYRKNTKLRYTGSYPLGGRIFCSSCGSFFGRKTLDKKRNSKEFWRCNSYYDGNHHPHSVDDSVVKDGLAKVMGILMDSNTDVIEQCWDMLKELRPKLHRSTYENLVSKIASNPGMIEENILFIHFIIEKILVLEDKLSYYLTNGFEIGYNKNDT